jgi:hypothetical protein
MALGAFLAGVTGPLQRGLEARQRTIDMMMQAGLQQRAAQRTGDVQFQRQAALFGLQQRGREQLAEEELASRRALMGEQFKLREGLLRTEADIKQGAEQERLERLFPGLMRPPAAPGPVQPGRPGVQFANGPMEPPRARVGDALIRQQVAAGNISGAMQLQRKRAIAEQAAPAIIPEPTIEGPAELPEILRAPRLPEKGPRDFKVFLGQWMQRRYGRDVPIETKEQFLKERGITRKMERIPGLAGAGQGPGIALESVEQMVERAIAKPSPAELKAARGEFEQLTKTRERFRERQAQQRQQVEATRGAIRSHVREMQDRYVQLSMQGATQEQISVALKDDQIKLMKLRGATDVEIANAIAPGEDPMSMLTIMTKFKGFSREGIEDFIKGPAFFDLMEETNIPRGRLVRILGAVAKLQES